jgi:16S rRNA (cytidine1402-2'-O)-methyltransferase
MEEAGRLFIVATPIGNPEDITLRAIKILQECDGVICEEFREGSSLLKKLGITVKELVVLNEHNEKTHGPEIINRIQKNQSYALISDCGTPVFADPGASLIALAVASGIRVIPVPGPSSLISALSILDFKPEHFVFSGFLSRQPDHRRQQLQRLRSFRMPVVIMDTPYRLTALLEDVERNFGSKNRITLACDLTLPTEKILRGPIGEIRKSIGESKAEFILIIHHE